MRSARPRRHADARPDADADARPDADARDADARPNADARDSDARPNADAWNADAWDADAWPGAWGFDPMIGLPRAADEGSAASPFLKMISFLMSRSPRDLAISQ